MLHFSRLVRGGRNHCKAEAHTCTDNHRWITVCSVANAQTGFFPCHQPQGAVSQCIRRSACHRDLQMFHRDRLAPERRRMRTGGVWLSFRSPSSVISKPDHLEKSLKTWWKLEWLSLSLRPSLISQCHCQSMSVYVLGFLSNIMLLSNIREFYNWWISCIFFINLISGWDCEQCLLWLSVILLSCL